MTTIAKVWDNWGFVLMIVGIVLSFGVIGTLLITLPADTARRQACAREFAGARTHYDSLAVKGALGCD